MSSTLDSDNLSAKGNRLTSTDAFLTIEAFPSTLLSELQTRYGNELRRAGTFDVERVSVKIGKEVSSFALSG